MKYKKGILYCNKTRRQFLVGSGKSLLALPLLPSLLPEAALASSSNIEKRMMLFSFDHCNLLEMWPSESVATQLVGNIGIKERLLSQMGTVASHSTALTNPLYEKLKNQNQLSYLRGFRQPNWDGCHGNMSIAAGGGRISANKNLPSIDSIIESSRSVYPEGTSLNIRKALRLQFPGGPGGFYKKVGSTTQYMPHYNYRALLNFYNDVFGFLTANTVGDLSKTNQHKSNILNKVLDAYNSSRNNVRISANDKVRLTQHMDYLSDIQRSYASVQTNILSCSKPNQPTTMQDDQLANSRLYIQLLSTAFKCGLTKFGIMVVGGGTWIPGSNVSNFHGAIHGVEGKDAQLRAYQTWWKYQADLIADEFLKPLDVEEGNTGRTYLDNMLTGMIATGLLHANAANSDGGHGGYDSQQILIGTMGGAVRGGRYYNLKQNSDVRKGTYPYNSFLITMLKLMGVQPSEYANATVDGQGFGSYDGYESDYVYKNRLYQPISEILT